MASKIFYAAMAAGIAFIVIGAASGVYTNTAVEVPLDNTVRPSGSDVITPLMDVGNTASITVSGSIFDVTIQEPDGQVLVSQNNSTFFSYDLTAQKSGEYRIVIENNGSEDLTVSGRAQTKSNGFGLTGALMLVTTGVIVIGLGLRFRHH